MNGCMCNILITGFGMLAYWCENLRRNHGSGAFSARFEYEMAPPFMRFQVVDWDAERTWTLENSHFNVQSRASLSSLRPSEAWRMNVGFNASGQFRIVEPATITPRSTMVLQLDCEISWGPEFINITGRIDGNYVLFSMRPPEGTRNAWVESRSEPPRPVYLRSDGSRMNEAQTRREPVTPAQVITPPSTVVEPNPPESPDLSDNRDIEVSSASTDTHPLESRNVADATPMMRLVEPITILGDNIESHDFPAIQIVEETTGINMFAPYRVGDIPFSVPNGNQPRPTVEQRPITIDDVPLGPGMTFEERMATVRLINAVRLDGNYGTVTGNRDYRTHAPTSYRNVEQLRPQIFITPEEARMTAAPPPPPAYAKPPPPPGPPPRIRPPPMFMEVNVSRNEIRRTLRSLNENFHPPMNPISQLSPNLLAVPVVTRTGVVHPVLPQTDASSSSTFSPQSSLRTTPEGIRLEITPVSMVFRSTPEETRSNQASSSSRSSSPSPSLPPELDPEA